MNITGLGTLTVCGRGLDALRETARQQPAHIEPDGSLEAMRIDAAHLTGGSVPRCARRADRFSKLAAVAASDAVANARLTAQECADAGVIIATTHGPHATTFEFTDGLLDFGEDAVSPTLFAHTVHGAAAYHVSRLLETSGPAATITRFGFPFYEALLIARDWLSEGRCEHVVVGCIDVTSPVLEYGFRELAAPPVSGTEECILRTRTLAPSEASVFLVLSHNTVQDAACISHIERNAKAQELASGESCLLLLDHDGASPVEAAYRQHISGPARVGILPRQFGSLPSGAALACAMGALLIQEQACFLNSTGDFRDGIPACDIGRPASVESVCIVKYDCSHTCQAFRITKPCAAQ